MSDERGDRSALERAELGALHAGHDTLHVPLGAPTLKGAFVAWLRRLALPLVQPYLERQTAYNAANARLASLVWEGLERLREEGRHLRDELRGQAQEAVQALASLRHQQDEAVQRLRAQTAEEAEALRRAAARLEERIEAVRKRQQDAADSLLEELRTRLEALRGEERTALASLERAVSEALAGLAGEQGRLFELLRARVGLPSEPPLDGLYAAFEAAFRGSREEIRERLSVYLPFLMDAKLGQETTPVLDLGSGRGEWLELLRDHGLHGRGVDSNSVFAAEARARGLAVAERDLEEHLSTLRAESVGCVTAFHVLEHLPLVRVVHVLDEALRVLVPGGLAIFETPNPANILVGSHRFYFDPTHRNPLPSATLEFLVANRGFTRTRVLELHPCPPADWIREDSEVARRMNLVFYGPQDYAVLGWKG